MNSVIERLRKQRATMISELSQRGRDAGREWITDEYGATYSQLKKLEQLESQGPLRNDVLNSDRCALELTEFLNVEFCEFWESAIGDDYEEISSSYDFVVGFVEGALEAWLQIKDQVEE